ncbi:MAG TPA: bifunctional DNA primase/polymerase [Streptosporangiaceae bacterium]|nr:bifunctional DNA primase/polymerase [Streptosporangiaceae bacterium]
MAELPGGDPRKLAASARAGRLHAGARGYVRCAGIGESVVLAFPYDPVLVREARDIGERRFDWNIRASVYPFTRLGQVVAFADAHGIEVSPQVRELVPPAGRPAPLVAAGVRGQATRDAAHLYLRHGLLPVPAWGARGNGACRCPHGAACARPGKHPRSVYIGPGPRDYSWKPLVCVTHEDVELRFAGTGRYAVANLMVAIPEGMLVIDQDFDDGGRQALADLAGRLGELPATLGHATPHGTHRIFRTPPGWTTRAWVGKDARNPVPAGIDLRIPGQVLMAPPSRVPAAEGMARYGPVVDIGVVDLPGAYVVAWTPQREQGSAGRRLAAVSPGRADAVAPYVAARVTGIARDLAEVKPGGRNAAIYTAALKVGSTIGAARSMPGGERATAIWTDEATESVLMAAAEENGYTADHSVSEARSAVRSGLRNGLRRPRPLPGGERLSHHATVGPVARQRDSGSGAGEEAPPGPTCRDSDWLLEPVVASQGGLPAAAGSDGRHASGRVAAADGVETGERGRAQPGRWGQIGSNDWRSVIVGQQPDERQHVHDCPGAAAEVQDAEAGS